MIWNKDFENNFPDLLAELSDSSHYEFLNANQKTE